ncbi:MAG: MBL fold metallo-hydrolase, partial [Rubrobacteraceae bacterium]
MRGMSISIVITAIITGHLGANLTDWYGLPPDHDHAGRVMLPVLCHHVSLPGRSVLVDAAACEPAVSGLTATDPVGPTLPERLAAAGVEARSISDVVITHAHFDHYNALTDWVGESFAPIFPNARHYLGAADWRPEHFGGLEKRTLEVVCRRGLLQLVEGTANLGDGLTLLYAPGETPGHQILRVEAEDPVAYFAGDLYHHPLEFSETRNVRWADQDAMRTSK